MDFQRLERVRIAVALLAAVITGGAALYGVHTKARQATAASYETLAPEINELKTAVRTLQEENAALRSAVTRPGAAATTAPASGAQARAPARPARKSRPTSTTPTPTSTPEQPAPVEAPPPAETPAPPAPAPAPAPERKVPIDFDKAVEIWKDIQDLRKDRPK